MFVPAIKGQGTNEQQQKWIPLAYKLQIIGCYAQTELGHGSNVQGLETTATFDPKTDEFVIHSPTLTSSKVSSRFYFVVPWILDKNMLMLLLPFVTHRWLSFFMKIYDAYKCNVVSSGGLVVWEKFLHMQLFMHAL